MRAVGTCAAGPPHAMGTPRGDSILRGGILRGGSGIADLASPMCRADGSDRDRVASAFVAAAIRLAPVLEGCGAPRPGCRPPKASEVRP